MEPVIGRGTSLPTLAVYAALLRAGWVRIVLATLIGTGLSLWMQSQLPRAYYASAAIELPPVASYLQIDPAASRPRPATIDTTALLVRSSPVIDAVAAVTRQPPQAIREGLSVSAYPLSHVLIVGYEAPSEQAARSGAEAAARATLAQRTAVFRDTQLAAARSLSARLESLRARAESKAPQFPNVSQRIDLLAHQLRVVLTASASEASDRIDTSDAARSVKAPPALYPTTGAVTGFMVGVGRTWWRKRPAGQHRQRRRSSSISWPNRRAEARARAASAAS